MRDRAGTRAGVPFINLVLSIGTFCRPRVAVLEKSFAFYGKNLRTGRPPISCGPVPILQITGNKPLTRHLSKASTGSRRLLVCSSHLCTLFAHIQGRGPFTLKRVILVAVAAVLFTPVLTNAQSWWGGPPNRHHHISGDEMAIAGFGGAALLAGLGYLALRRREN